MRRPLETTLAPSQVALALAADRRPFALTGSWLESEALLGSDPLAESGDGDDPFSLLERMPCVEEGDGDGVGGGWVGYLGYQLGGCLERLPPGPPRPRPVPASSLAFYDHVLRLSGGHWRFEALWTPERAAALEERFRCLSRRLQQAPPPPRVAAPGPFTMIPDPAAHRTAVARVVEYIRAGDVFQTNLCLRLEGAWNGGSPVALWARAIDRLHPPRGAYLSHPLGHVLSLSPELFLRRSGRLVTTSPIKGTAPRDEAMDRAERQRATLVASAKDRAENVMIVDLMRNDLGRICEPGSVRVPSLLAAEPHPGLWHLVSKVEGRLRPDVGNGALLRATFPPGSVTGAPKVRAMEVIAELETTSREIYTGGIGIASPLAGLELNVAIRTFEISGGRIWLGAGGGIVADSDPACELAECLAKAIPLLDAIGSRLF